MDINKKKLTIPTHIAFIMDGNRRWAVKHGLNKMVGHKQGGVALKNIIETLVSIDGIKYASFFAFSTENWNRSPKEISHIFDVAYDLLADNEETFLKQNVKVIIMGDVKKFPDKLRTKLEDIVEKTKLNSGLVVNLAMNYGGRDDIVNAANRLIEKNVNKITIENLKENLYSADAPDIDLLVRTSGEMRISNFMLFQMAYSELYFTKKYWPDFDEKQLYKALKAFSKRDRRFGGK